MKPKIIKICGITREEDALSAIKYGSNTLGFIFYKKSKRYIEPSKVKKIIQTISNTTINKVGVFVDENPDNINKIAKECQLTHIQLHGDESPALCKQINYPIIK